VCRPSRTKRDIFRGDLVAGFLTCDIHTLYCLKKAFLILLWSAFYENLFHEENNGHCEIFYFRKKSKETIFVYIIIRSMRPTDFIPCSRVEAPLRYLWASCPLVFQPLPFPATELFYQSGLMHPNVETIVTLNEF